MADLLLSSTPKKGTLRVWHIPQVPMKPFHVPVSSVEEARKILQILADYDLFQLENRIKPDYSNAAGLEVYDPADISEENDCDGWCEWRDEEGLDVDGHY